MLILYKNGRHSVSQKLGSVSPVERLNLVSSAARVSSVSLMRSSVVNVAVSLVEKVISVSRPTVESLKESHIWGVAVQWWVRCLAPGRSQVQV